MIRIGAVNPDTSHLSSFAGYLHAGERARYVAVYNNFHQIHHPFETVIMTTEKTFQFRVDTHRIYGALLDQVLDRLETGCSKLVDVPALSESIKIMLAGRLSRLRGGIEVKLSDIPPDDPGFDGNAFEKRYAER